MSRNVRKAVIPAAGKGTRLYPVTRSVPKELLPLGSIPAIDFVVAEAVDAGIEEVVIVSSRQKLALETHFRLNPPSAKITFVYQADALGLGHAVGCAEDAVGNEPFAVLLPDDLYQPPFPTTELVRIFGREQKSVVALCEVPLEQVPRYGVVKVKRERDGLLELEDLLEKPTREQAPSRLMLPGRYVLQPSIFAALKETKPGAGGEIQLTDALRVVARRDGLLGYRVQSPHHDVGNAIGLLLAGAELLLRDATHGSTLRTSLRALLAG